MNFNIYNSIILAGVIQGLLFTLIVLTSKKYKNRSIYFLAALILCISLENLQFLLIDIDVINYDILYNYFYIPYTIIAPVFLLMYGILLLKISTNKRQIKFLYFPFIVLFIYYTIIKIIMIFDLNKEFFFNAFWYIESIEEILSIIFGLSAILFLLLKIIIYNNNIKVQSLKKVLPQINWFKNILLSLLILSFIWVFIAYKEIAFETDNLTYYYPLQIGMSFMIYWLGHIGIYKYGITEERKKIRSYYSTQIYSPLIHVNNHIKDLEELLVKKQHFLNPTLTLSEVAEELNLSKSHLSRIINNELNISFTDYLNSLRVEKAKEYIDNSEFKKYTIVAIGLEAGFNSKSTFNKAFKKVTGRTPSEYKRHKTNNLE